MGFRNATKKLTFCSLLTRCTIPCACHAKRCSHVQKWRAHVAFCRFWLRHVLRAKTAFTFSTSQLLTRCSGAAALCTFWLRNVLRAATACAFSTSQLLKVVRGMAMGCFVHFDLEIYFAPQRRATFSSLIWPHGFAPAALASLLFDPPEQQTIGKTECFATFLPFCAPGSSFFWDFLFFDLLSSSLLFSYSSHLCFSSVHVVGSLTSKLPSISSNGCNYEKQYT